MRQTKLISGQMNVPYIVCKPGYAEGVRKPKRVVKPVLFNPVLIIRKNEIEAGQ